MITVKINVPVISTINLIKEVIMYKYLGIELDNRLTFKAFKGKLLTKAKANMNRVWFMGMKSGDLSVKAAMNLYDALVRSQLEYGSEIWGWDKWDDGENIQLQMGRRILGCIKNNKRIYTWRFGLWTLNCRRNFKKLVFWDN